MLNIAPALYGQSDKYIRLWIYVFDQLAKGNNRIAVASLISQSKASRQTMNQLLSRGVEVFNQHGIGLNVQRKHSTDSTIVFSISQSIIQTTKTTQVTKVKEPKKDKPNNDQQSLAINAIVTYLNEVTNKQYRTDNATTVRLIIARLNNGFTLEQFKYVIDVKAAHWMNSEMEKYLRPETLFGNKFEGYLNETFANNKPNELIRNAEESINRNW